MDIGIVGGGIAGLYSALLLREEGHRVTVFEASSRLGGRIYTHHFKPVARGEDPFFEAGAMRVPLSSFHSYVFGLALYLNAHNDQKDRIEFIPYVLSHVNNRIYLQGRMRKCEDTSLAADMGLPPRYRGKSARQILLEVMSPWIKLLRDDFEEGFSEVLRYDDMTFRHYLHTVAMLPHEVIDFVELIMSQTNQYDLSFTDLVMQTLHFNTPEWVTVKGGLTRIIAAAAKVLGPASVIHNAPVTEIHEMSDGRIELVVEGISRQTRIFDKVILAVPPAAIQKIRTRPHWSFMKEQAIRSIHEGPLYKMGLHFRSRFWEKTSEPCYGGQTQTDLPIRWIVYPSNDMGSSKSGCLILYSGMTDALRWSWMTREERIKLALEDLDNFFRHEGINVYDQFLDALDVHWPGEFTYANTMYLPSQFSRFYETMKKAEGNVYFAVVVRRFFERTRHGEDPPTAPVKLGRAAAYGAVIHMAAELDGTLDLRNRAEVYQCLDAAGDEERVSQHKVGPALNVMKAGSEGISRKSRAVVVY